MDRIACLLPGGYVDETGAVHRQAELTPLSGQEEAFLTGNQGQIRARLVTAVLSRCLRRLGTISPVPEEIVRQLLVADRQYLLLKLRQAAFGNQVQSTIQCPWADCGHKIDIDFSVEDVPIVESADKGPVYAMQLSAQAVNGGVSSEMDQELTFRLPNGRDQELITPLLAENADEATVMLLARCVQRLGSQQPPDEDAIRGLLPLARMEIERQMEAAAPKVELTMSGDCPECGQAFAIPFNLEDFFFKEMGGNRDLLYREIHYLAYHYHWSEQEIMSMSQAKRRQYITVLAEEIEKLNDAVW
ncbi:MAG: hypothetical protein GY803_30020 [Chloroflexi bacterium]|nr:hypothetical protein [Chloroflexota bacterium]